jgi:inosine-uridine nucleoside N-ribohydrolase
MARKVFLIADPGIDGAFAVAVALRDPALEVVGMAASAGNVSAEKATRNLHALLELADPPRYPRLGAALPVTYPRDAAALHGPDGLGGANLPDAPLHHPHPADKVLADALREHPKEVAVVVLGPATVLARAFDRDPEASRLVERVVLVGGAWHEPGDAGPVSEFHFALDPPAARQVLRSGAPVTLLPLDVTRRLVLSPSDLLSLPGGDAPVINLLRKAVPCALNATSGLFGVEGVFLQDVLGPLALAQPAALTTRLVHADVEPGGELTRGMSVFDTRWGGPNKPNVDVAVAVDVAAARQYLLDGLARYAAG